MQEYCICDIADLPVFIPASVEMADNAFLRCDSLSIHSPEGSPAQQWAEDNEVQWELWEP
jgi:hypothetical protein